MLRIFVAVSISSCLAFVSSCSLSPAGDSSGEENLGRSSAALKGCGKNCVDAGRDAGVDAGHDAGVDAGQDAGFDAGVDAGPPPPPELCNGLDDDHDGHIDEGFPCASGAPAICQLTDGGQGLGTCSSTCTTPNPSQCQTLVDSDGDGVPDAVDLFPSNPSERADNDRDGTGDNADTDDDNDGILDVADQHPKLAEVSISAKIPPVMLVGEAQSFILSAGGPLAEFAYVRPVSLPSGATYDPSTRTLTWTPTAAALGERLFVVIASAAGSTAEVTKTLRTVVARPLTGASATIGTAGGVVTITDSTSPAYGVSLNFPAGALSAPTLISVRPLEANGANIDLAGTGTSYGTTLLLEPRGIKFMAPVDLTLPADVSVSGPNLSLSAIEPNDAFGLRGEPRVSLMPDGRWHAQLGGFSVVRMLAGLPTTALNSIGGLVFNGGRPIDLLAQDMAVKCAWRLQCSIAAGTTSSCGAFAALNRCLWEAYQEASALTGDSYSPAQFLGSLYNLSVSDLDPYFWPGLGLEPFDGSRAGRPSWLTQHLDADPVIDPNNNFRKPYANDPDNSGRKDHFVTSARTVGLTGSALTVLEPFLGGSMNDAATNWQGMQFGALIALGQLKDGPSIEQFVKSSMCENTAEALSGPQSCACGQKAGSNGCCQVDPSVDPSTCVSRIDSISTSTLVLPADTTRCPTATGYYITTLATVSGQNLRPSSNKHPSVGLYTSDGNLSFIGSVVPNGGNYCFHAPLAYASSSSLVGYPLANGGNKGLLAYLSICTWWQEGCVLYNNITSSGCFVDYFSPTVPTNTGCAQ